MMTKVEQYCHQRTRPKAKDLQDKIVISPLELRALALRILLEYNSHGYLTKEEK